MASTDSGVTAAKGSLPTGELLSRRFRVVRLLGLGGMGEVYEAIDEELDLPIALKTVRPEIANEKRAFEQLRREVLLARRVTHPNVCRIYDLWRHRGKAGTTLFVTMEMLDGETLDARLERTGSLPLEEVKSIALALGSALDAAHRAGVVHRDIKPGNVLIERTGEAERIVVTDFGIATMPGSGSFGWIGTPAYMAPEQLRGDAIGHEADLYALGVVLYEALTGRLPYETASVLSIAEQAVRRAKKPAPPSAFRPEIEPHWSNAILRCLEPDPERRFSSARDLLKALGIDRGASPRSVAVVPTRIARPPETGRPGSWGAGAPEPSSDETIPLTLAQEVVIGILSRGDEIRVPRASDSFRIQRDLALSDGPSTPSAIVRLAHALGVEQIVTLAIDARGTGSLVAEIWSGSTARRVDRITTRADNGDWVHAAEEIGGMLRRQLGLEPLSSAAQERVLALVPRGDAARRAFSEGASALRARDLPRATAKLQLAAELDPDCAAIHAALADALEVSGEQAAAAAAARRAVESSALLDRREQIELEARERGFALDRERAEELYRALVIFYPEVTEYALRLAALLAQSGRSTQALEVLSGLREQRLPAEERLRADAIEADIRLWMGDLHGGEEMAQRSKVSAHALGAIRSLARAHQAIGTARIERGELDSGIPELEEALRLYREVGDIGAECFVGGNLGYAALSAGRLDEAESRFRESVALAHRLGLRQALGTPLHNLAMIESRRGRPKEALSLYREALDHHVACGNRHHMAHTLGGVASMLRILGQVEEARSTWEEALAISLETSDQLGEVMLRCGLGEFLLESAGSDRGVQVPDKSEGAHDARGMGPSPSGARRKMGSAPDDGSAPAESTSNDGFAHSGSTSNDGFARSGSTADDGFAHLARALELAERNKFRSWIFRLRGASARGRARQGDLEGALAHLDVVVWQDPPDTPAPREELLGWLDRAAVLGRAGKSAESEEIVNRVSVLAARSQDFELGQRTALLRVEAAERDGRTDDAVTLLEEIEKAFLSHDHVVAASSARTSRQRLIDSR